MSHAAQTDQEHLENAVELLIDRYGPDDAEDRLLAALSEVRKHKHREKQ